MCVDLARALLKHLGTPIGLITQASIGVFVPELAGDPGPMKPIVHEGIDRHHRGAR